MTKNQEIKDIYRQGFIDGMTSYAWWKDGVQYVGTGGTTLETAIKKLNEDDLYIFQLRLLSDE